MEALKKMKRQLYKKGIVVGLIVLFFGASAIPAAFSTTQPTKTEPLPPGRGFLMIPDSLTKSVGMYSPSDGSYLGDLIVDATHLSTPINAVKGPGGNIYVSDQIADSVFVYAPNGTYLYTYADATDGLDNIRGIDFRGTELFISKGGTGGTGGKCIARFSGPHIRLPDFITSTSGIDPFDIIFLPDGSCLIADIAGTTDNIRSYSANGTLLQILFPINFPEQVSFDSLAPGAFLTAGFSANIVRDFELNGTIVQDTPYSGARGVFRLGNGNILATSGAGIQEIQPGTGVIIQTEKTGSGRFIELFATGANQPPNVPSAPNPANGTTNVPINKVLSWTGGDPDPGDYVTYDVYFGTTSPPPKIVSNQSTPSYTPAGLAFNTQYYWKIVSWDNQGATTAGPEWSFMTQINNPPNAPSNPDPQNGAENVSLNKVLTWSGGDPDPGDTVTYDVYFGITSPPPKVINNQSTLSYTPADMNFNEHYYWKIIAWDSGDLSTSSPIWEFFTITDTTPPTTTHTLAGTLGNDDWYISNVTITLVATDDVSGVDTIFIKIDGGSWTAYVAPVVVSVDGEHTVNYYAVDKAGNEETEKTVNFKKDKTPPVFDEYTFTALNALKNKWLCVANVTDATSGIVKVDFYVDDAFVGSDTTAPYEFEYNGKPKTSSQAIAYDAAGHSAMSDLATYVSVNAQQQSYYPQIQILRQYL